MNSPTPQIYKSSFQNIALIFFSKHCLLPLLTELYDFLNTTRKGKAAACDSDFSLQRVNRSAVHLWHPLLAAPFAFPAKLVVFLPATLIKKERPFFLEVFRHTGHSEHLLFTAELPICSRNAETPKTVSRCMVSGRFWAFSFDMSGFVLTAVSLPSAIQKPLFVTSG